MKRAVRATVCVSAVLMAAGACAGQQAAGREAAAQGDAGVPAGAAARTLHVGDSAPRLTIASWVKGQAVDGFEAGKVYVVEFWATWCPPCRKSIPHLTALQQRHKDAGLVVIGVSSTEQRGLADVEPFVSKMGDKIGYRVAWDDRGQTSRAWMDAAGQDEIPTAFVVNQDGRVAWIGHPLAGLDKAVEAVLGKTFDLEKAAAQARRRAELDRLEAPIAAKMDAAYEVGDLDEVLRQLDALIALDPPLQGRWIFERYRVLAADKNDPAGAQAYAEKVGAAAIKDDFEALNQIAWHMLSRIEAGSRRVNVALALATRANQITGGGAPEVLDTYAAALFQSGDKARAVEVQRAAVEKSSDDEMRREYAARLTEYERAAGSGKR